MGKSRLTLLWTLRRAYTGESKFGTQCREDSSVAPLFQNDKIENEGFIQNTGGEELRLAINERYFETSRNEIKEA